MAKIKYTSIVDYVSGKLNGVIFVKGKNGNYVKRNSYSQQKNTLLQSHQRNRIQQVSQKWRELTLAQKILWNEEAINYPRINSSSQTYYYTGFQLFLFLNNNRFVNGYSINKNVPSYVAVQSPAWVFNVRTNGWLDIVFPSSVGGQSAILYACFPKKTEDIPKENEYKMIQTRRTFSNVSKYRVDNIIADYFSLNFGWYNVWLKIKFMRNSSGFASEFSMPQRIFYDFSNI